jgi:Glycosyltransferase family 87
MGRVLATLQTGDWLTLERIRLVAGAVLFASLAGLCYLIATSEGLNDYTGRPLGTDFSNVYAAGQLVLEGNPAAPYDPAVHRERERAIFGEKTPFYGWLYPPFFLFVAAGLALMSYPVALAVWQGVSLLLYLLSIRAILRNPASCGRASTGQKVPNELWLLLAVSFPAVFVNIGHGHNGFLTAALLGGGLVLLDRRPIIAGILLGLLAYKPQFGLMIPIVPLKLLHFSRFSQSTHSPTHNIRAQFAAGFAGSFGADFGQARYSEPNPRAPASHVGKFFTCSVSLLSTGGVSSSAMSSSSVRCAGMTASNCRCPSTSGNQGPA